jgi:hypothetical protein
VRAKGRCSCCYDFRKKHGFDRPPELVEKEIERDAATGRVRIDARDWR